MRIIAGACRGRRIRAPEGDRTRPMLDRVRESLFATLRDWIADAKVLDLFAGSGSLGLEALSRGARAVRALEKDRRTLELLRANAAELGLEERVECAAGDALEPNAWRGGALFGGSDRWDLVFVDPPYPSMVDPASRSRVLAALEVLAREHLEPAARIVLHVPRGLLAEHDFARSLEPTLRTWGSNDLWIIGVRRSGAST